MKPTLRRQQCQGIIYMDAGLDRNQSPQPQSSPRIYHCKTPSPESRQHIWYHQQAPQSRCRYTLYLNRNDLPFRQRTSCVSRAVLLAVQDLIGATRKNTRV
ncbi:hypothetical protein BJX65DRAFT_75399 [Aspergillus insuetus]